MINKVVSGSFESHFGDLKDPRIKRLKLYPLTEILFVVRKVGEISSFLEKKN